MSEALPQHSTTPKGVHMVPDRPRLPSIKWERGEGLLLSLPSLSRRAIYLGAYIRRGRRSHIGWGRQFLDGPQPWWSHYIWWGRF